ncbi:hypothetical protein [Lelliottia wanjuensis]|uniref:Uncharacterized protein n=1 Tax=Lelliottia wanjuensis TaxID=3050585 RepID=A0AAP4LDJ9_9ENTR|nr:MULTISPECIES: hypothetical protein [unclassified Lelliottia]MDK9366435.1 hypothetical protein [Lelliottia sp. V106_12]MDK9618696.1 hypothetical protein [Lelliottia sp. V106_9]
MASREYYRKQQQDKLDKLLNNTTSVNSPQTTTTFRDAFSAEESADIMMDRTLRSVYESQFSESFRSEKHYRKWLRQQGRNEKGYVVTTIVDSLDIENRKELTAKDRMMFQCRLHDEAVLSHAREIFEAIPRTESFKQFLDNQCKLSLLDTNATFNMYSKVRTDDYWCNYIANARRDGADQADLVRNDTGKNIRF